MTKSRLKKGIKIDLNLWNSIRLHTIIEKNKGILLKDVFDDIVTFDGTARYRVYDKNNNILQEGSVKNEARIDFTGNGTPYKVKLKIDDMVNTYYV